MAIDWNKINGSSGNGSPSEPKKSGVDWDKINKSSSSQQSSPAKSVVPDVWKQPSHGVNGSQPVMRAAGSTPSTPAPEVKKEEGFFTKALKFVLPKSAEDYFGLNENPIKEEIKKSYEEAYAVEDTRRLMEDVNAGGGKLSKKTAGEVLKETSPEKLMPFASSIPDIVSAVQLYQSVKRAEKGEETAVDIYRMAKAKAEMERDSTFGAKVTSILTGLPSFGGELLATGGVFTAGKKATETALTKALGKYSTTKAGSLAVKGTGTLVGGTLQTIPAGLTRIPAGTIQNMIPDYSFSQGEMGSLEPIMQGGGDDLWTAAKKSLASQWVETVTEHSGGMFTEALAPVKNQLMKIGILKAFLKVNPTAKSTDFMKLVKSAGWNGVLEEMGEERVADVAYGILTQAGLSDQGFQIPTPEQLAVELVAFSVPGAMINITNKALSGESSFKTEGTTAAKPITEAENIIAARDLLTVAKNGEGLSSDQVSILNNTLNEYQDIVSENVLEVPGADENSLSTVKVIQYPDGKWGYSYDINTSENGINAGFLTNKLTATKEEAIAAAKADILDYVNKEIVNVSDQSKAEFQKIAQTFNETKLEEKKPAEAAKELTSEEKTSDLEEELIGEIQTWMVSGHSEEKIAKMKKRAENNPKMRVALANAIAEATIRYEKFQKERKIDIAVREKIAKKKEEIKTKKKPEAKEDREQKIRDEIAKNFDVRGGDDITEIVRATMDFDNRIATGHTPKEALSKVETSYGESLANSVRQLRIPDELSAPKKEPKHVLPSTKKEPPKTRFILPLKEKFFEQQKKIAKKLDKEIQKSRFVKPMQKVGKTVPAQETAAKILLRKPELPILSEMKVKDGKLTATNLEMALTLNTELLDGMYKMIGKDAVKTDTDPAEFPNIPEVKEAPSANISIPLFAAKLKEAILSIDRGTKTYRQELTGIYLKGSKDGLLTIASTDSYRLYSQQIPAKITKDFEMILGSPENISKVLEAIGDTADLSIRADEHQIKLSGKNGDLIARTIDGEYPKYKEIFPEYTKRYSFDKKSLLTSLKTLKPYGVLVDIAYGKGEMTLKTENKENKTSKEIVLKTSLKEVKEGSQTINNGVLLMPTMDAGFNTKYLIDAVNAMENDQIYIYQNADRNSPAFFSNEETLKTDKKTETKPETEAEQRYKILEPALTTKIVKDLEGKETVSKQYILDATNRPEIRQREKDIIREVAAQFGDKINVKDFSERVKAELLPLKMTNAGERYEFVSLPYDFKGNVANYEEHIWQSPIKTSAGNIHFPARGGRTADEQALYRANNTIDNYFGHTRIEDMAPSIEEDTRTISQQAYDAGMGKESISGSLRRVIEVQSDLYQKGRLEEEANQWGVLKDDESVNSIGQKELDRRLSDRKPDVTKLQQYNDPTAHFRLIREEIRQAAEDGKTRLQLPTGETAMKIEGLSSFDYWKAGAAGDNISRKNLADVKMYVGMEAHVANQDSTWVVTDILDDGKFKAVEKSHYDNIKKERALPSESDKETFDISGKVDTNNPIYKFYEKEVGRYLKSRYGSKMVTDNKGVTWWEVEITPEMARTVEAFKVRRGLDLVNLKVPENDESEFDTIVEDAKKELRTMFDENEVKFFVNNKLLKQERENMGKDEYIIGQWTSIENIYKRRQLQTRSLMELVENDGKVSSSTMYHEAFHAYFGSFVSAKERKFALDTIKKSRLTAPYRLFMNRKVYETEDIVAEEWLADDFADYVANKKSRKTNGLERIWRSIVNRINSWIRKEANIEKIYEDILSKKRGQVYMSEQRRRFAIMEKADRDLLAEENEDLSLPELKEKLRIAIEGKEEYYLIDKVINEIRNRVNKVRAPSGNAAAGANAIGTFEELAGEPNKTPDQIKLFEKVKDLIKKYASTIGENYLPSNALGVYYGDSKNIRIKGMNNLSVASHEITHFLDFSYNISSQLQGIEGYAINGNPIYAKDTAKLRKEMTDIYEKYYPGASRKHKLKKRMLEGFATLLERYTEQPSLTTKEFPNLVNDFLTKGGKYYKPVMGDIIKDLQGIVKNYQGLSALDKIGTRIIDDAVNVNKDSFLNFADKLKTEIADEIYPTEKLAKKSGLHFTKQDISLWLRQYNNLSTLILNNINGDRGYWGWRNGEIVKLHDYNWKTLINQLKNDKMTQKFSSYLVARREYFAFQELKVLEDKVVKFRQAVEEAKEMAFEKPEGGLSGEKSLMSLLQEAIKERDNAEKILTNDGFVEKEVADAYLQNKEAFAEYSKMFDDLTREDLNFLYDPEVQLINHSQYNQLANQEGYASFKRFFYDEVAGEEQTPMGNIRVGKTKISSMMKRTGSQKPIINPLFSSLRNHAEITRKGLKQIVYNQTPVYAAAFPTMFQKLKLTVVPDAEGKLMFPQEKDPNIVMTRVGYKKVPFLVDKSIKGVIDGVLTFQNINVFEQLLMGSSRFFTKGTTGLFPAFSLSNTAIDQITAASQTRNKFIPLYDQLTKLFKAFDPESPANKYYNEYMVMGGERQTMVGWQDMTPNELFSVIEGERKGLVKMVNALNSGMDFLALPSKWSEIGTRATEYIKARNAGKSSIVALEEAGRVTAPFHHVGRWGGGRIGKTWIKSIPFFNPTIQVLSQVAETLETPEGRARYAFVTFAVTAASIAAMALLLARGTDEQKDLFVDLYPDELTKYIFIPDPNGKTLDKIRVPDQMAPIATIINMMIADKYLGAKYTAGQYIDAGTSWIPAQFDPTDPVKMFLGWIPQLIKPGILTVAGVKDYPKVLPLESQSQTNKSPGYRFNESTSPVAKWFGEKFGISPIKFDYLLTGYAGRATGFLTGKPGIYNPFKSLQREYYFTSGRNLQKFYEMKDKNDQMYSDYMKERKTFTDDQINKIYEDKGNLKGVTDLVDYWKDLDPVADKVEMEDIRNQIINAINEL